MITHLLGLAFPAFLTLVWPFSIEGCFASFYHVRQGWILLAILLDVDSNRRRNGPAAVWRMFEVLLEWIVARFPTV